MGFGIICSFKHPLGILEWTPRRKGGTTVWIKNLGKRHHWQPAPAQRTSNKFMRWELPWLIASFSADTSPMCIKNLIYNLCIGKIGNSGLREEGTGLGLQESTWCLQELGLLEHPETFILLQLQEMWLIPQTSLVPGDGRELSRDLFLPICPGVRKFLWRCLMLPRSEYFLRGIPFQVSQWFNVT